MGENTEKYRTFNVPLKNIKENNKLITSKLKFIDNCRLINASLSNLTDNLSEIDKKECKPCKERKNITSQWAFFKLDFLKFFNNRLIYKYKKCDGISYKPIDTLKEKFLNTYQLCNKTAINLYYYWEKAFILMNTGIAGKNLMKLYYHPKKNFIMIYIRKF